MCFLPSLGINGAQRRRCLLPRPNLHELHHPSQKHRGAELRPDGPQRWETLLGNPYTPPKFNMEPENDGFQEELPFLGTSFQVPC